MIEEDFRHLALSMTRAGGIASGTNGRDSALRGRPYHDVDLNAESSHRAANRAATLDIALAAPAELV